MKYLKHSYHLNHQGLILIVIELKTIVCERKNTYLDSIAYQNMSLPPPYIIILWWKIQVSSSLYTKALSNQVPDYEFYYSE